MFFDSYTVFIYVLLFIAGFNAVKRFVRVRWASNVVLLAANLLLLLTLVKEHSLIVLAVLSLLVYLTGRWLQKKPNAGILAGSVALLICLFSVRNYAAVQTIFDGVLAAVVNKPILSVQKVGLSYILFRFVHWLIESRKQTIHQSDFLTFLSYIFFFPNFLAGPIDRYNNFHYWLGKRHKSYQWSLFFAGTTRVLLGAAKTLLLVPLIIEPAVDYTVLAADYSPWAAFSLSALAYSAYIYLDFSGYCDIAIGTGYMVGIKTPENFNSPYLASSMSDFWKRWHITFSEFLSAYVFKPVLALINKTPLQQHRMAVTVVGYLITFAICGLWHGSTLNFLYWGLWNGAGLAINKVWSTELKKRGFDASQRWYQWSSVVLTFLFVTLGWQLFNYEGGELVLLYNYLFQ